jgi:hypothetical protein
MSENVMAISLAIFGGREKNIYFFEIFLKVYIIGVKPL